MTGQTPWPDQQNRRWFQDSPWNPHSRPCLPEIRLKFCQVPFPPELTRDLWRNVQCPVLLVFGDSSMLHPAIRLMGDLNENQEGGSKIRNMIGEFKDIEYHIIESAGHNLHHDKPEIVMEIMELFL